MGAAVDVAPITQALQAFPTPDYNALQQQAFAWAQAAAQLAAAGRAVPWVPIPVIPAVIPPEFVSRKPTDSPRELNHKQPGLWVVKNGTLLAQAIAWRRNWPEDPIKAAFRTTGAINIARSHDLPIGLGLVTVGNSGAVALDADAKAFPGGVPELDAAMASAVDWATAHGLYVERSGSGGLHILGIAAPDTFAALEGQFAAGNGTKINAGEVRGGSSYGFLVVAPTWIQGKPGPYTPLHPLDPSRGATWPTDWISIGIAPAKKAARTTTSRLPQTDKAKSTRKRRASSPGDWIESSLNAPCPICGRTDSGACSFLKDRTRATCKINNDRWAIAGLDVDTEPGPVVTGKDGRRWQFYEIYEGPGGIGDKRKFKLHTEPEALPTVTLQAETRELAISNHILKINEGRGDNDPARSFLLTDAPGTGKTHLVENAARILLATDNVSLVIYCSPDYRSPSIPVLKTWAEVKSRHDGIEEYVVNGTRKRRRRKQNSFLEIVENPSCLMSRKLGALRAQGLSSEQESKICQKCDLRPRCKYVKQQTRFVSDLQRGKNTRIRCSISSLPALRAWAGEDRWRQTVIFIDEAPQLLNACARTIELPYDTLKLWACDIHRGQHDYESPQLLVELLHQLIDLPTIFKQKDDASEGRTQFTRFGFNLLELTEHLGQWRSRLPDAGAPPSWLLDPDLPPIDLSQDNPLITAHLLLPSLIQAALRSDGAALHATPEALVLTLPALPAIHQALDASAGAIVLDGTAHLQDVRHWLAPHHHNDVSAARSTDTDGIEHVLAIQVTGAGSFPSNRRDAANDHRDRFIAAITRIVGDPAAVGVIDFAKHVKEGWGPWWAASRSTNAFQNCRSLILVGRPNISWGAGLSQFAVAHRNDPQTIEALSAAFSGWYVRRTVEEIVQAIYRLRPAQRRPEEALTVFLLSDADPGDIGTPVVPIPAAAFSWAAGSPAHQLLHEAVRILRNNPERQWESQWDVADALIEAGALGIKPDASRAAVRRRLQRALQDLDVSWEDFTRHVVAFADPPPE